MDLVDRREKESYNDTSVSNHCNWIRYLLRSEIAM